MCGVCFLGKGNHLREDDMDNFVGLVHVLTPWRGVVTGNELQ